jgi:hypothetical protein
LLADPDFPVHPKKARDLAALVLAKPLDLKYVAIANLPDPSDANIKKMSHDIKAPMDCSLIFTVVGCGDHGGLENPKLQTVSGSTTLIDGEHYEKGGALFAMGAKTSIGDSGGPLFIRDKARGWTVVGTLVGLSQSDKGVPVSLYVPLVDHLDFIYRVLKEQIY